MKLPASTSRLEFGVYALSLTLCFLLFKQADLTHTNSSSFAYLYGHFGDFYEYNKTRMGDNNYLPIFYWIFALWNLPLKLIGLIPEVTSVTWLHPTVIQTIWSKLLLAVFFFGSVNLVGKIANQISPATKDGVFGLGPKLLFATSPIAIFSVFIFSGYDVFGLFFSLLGLHAYFAKKWKWFAFWFSVAISFKYFAAIIYLPLVLIVEKRFLYLIIFGVAGLAVSAMQFALYWHSDVFMGQIFGLVGAKTVGAAGATIKIRPILANAVYVFMCCYLYFSKFDFRVNLLQWSQRAMYACMLSYALLFSWVLWHPQWIILITPFVCLSFLFIRSQNLLLLIEILGYLGFAIYTMNNWAGNVDNTMLYGGVFGEYFPQTGTLVTDVIGREWMAISRVFLYSSLYASLLIFLFESYVSKRATDNTSVIQTQMLFRMRFLVACYFVTAATLACFL